ncbi:MAG: nucleotidyltransferase domain-containing protein [Magnetococcales bacterium]|nr:nucleotidyltransferase domain-containing protein [Magnetococcales bacterium]
MATPEALQVVTRYLHYLKDQGMPIAFGVLYGSQARGDARPDSDFDLMVVSSQFDQPNNWNHTERLWKATVYTDSRIEPIGIGAKQWEEDESFPLIDIARQEGQIIPM